MNQQHAKVIERIARQAVYAVLDAQEQQSDPHGPAYVAVERELGNILQAGQAMREWFNETEASKAWDKLMEGKS